MNADAVRRASNRMSALPSLQTRRASRRNQKVGERKVNGRTCLNLSAINRNIDFSLREAVVEKEQGKTNADLRLGHALFR